MHKYAFLLWREPILSLAELRSLFSDVSQSGPFALIEGDDEKIKNYKNSLGGTIKIAKIFHEWVGKKEVLTRVVEKISTKVGENKKLRIGIDTFIPSLRSLVFKAKDALREQGFSIRVVQHDEGRLKTATTIHEKLIEQGIELIVYPDKEGCTIAETIWVQDIESYSQRDMERDRSMTVGMMPPKIAQIMINLATKGDKSLTIWDPFCGLGTTLIEAFHGGYIALRGSDLEWTMVTTTQKNLESQPGYWKNIDFSAFTLDAKKLDTYENTNPTVIVTEWMLGRNFTTNTITRQSAFQERALLTELCTAFLESAYKNKSIKRVVFCLPFWNIWTETLYMPEVHWLTKKWSLDSQSVQGKRYLSHMRPGQCVGREIVILER